jgi:hypothetical protein
MEKCDHIGGDSFDNNNIFGQEIQLIKGSKNVLVSDNCGKVTNISDKVVIFFHGACAIIVVCECGEVSYYY